MKVLAAIFAIALIGACNTSQPPAPSTSQASASPIAHVDGAAASASAADASKGPIGGDIEIFLEAARSDVQKPYPRSPVGGGHAAQDQQDATADQLYAEAAARLLGEPIRSVQSMVAGETVAYALSRTSDPRGATALAAWAMRDSTYASHFRYALTAMADRPRPEYLNVAKKVVSHDSFSGQYERAVDIGLFSEAVGARVLGSTSTLALLMVSKIGNDEARSYLRELATDRTRSTSSTQALGMLVCCHGQRIEDEAKAVASIRIVALSLLRDKDLAHSLAGDATESSFIRKWAAAMEKGETPKARERRIKGKRGMWSASPCPPDPEGPCLGL